jgi:LAS superfamily LD-carboxypeptidase LdcB
VLTETPVWPELQATRRPSPRGRRPAGRRAQQRRRRRWTIGVAAVAVSLVAAAGTAYAVGLFDPATDVAEQSSAVADAHAAVAESVTLRTELAAEAKDAKALLKSPDGKAAAQADRGVLDAAIKDAQDLVTALGSVTRSPSGTEQQATAVLKVVATLREEVRAVTSTLRDASRAVVASGRRVRVDRAVSGLEVARTGLRETATAGERAYAEAAAAADTADRDSLRAALDRAGGLDGQADELLATLSGNTGPDLLGQAGKLTATMTETEVAIEDAAAAVFATTDGDIATEPEPADADPAAAEEADTATTTTPAGTCPEPDQVWSAENGHLSSSELASIPFASSHYVRADVVGGLTDLNAAYAAEFGANLTINSSYRTYAQQEALYDPSSDTAAPPGCSNHGTGLAIDIGGGVEAFGSAQYDWLKANAEAYGWVHPPFAEPSGRNPEPWHWQSVQAPNSY